jgi:hypothetical protein
MFVGHKISFRWGEAPDEPFLIFASAREDARPPVFNLLPGNKKAPTQDEKGRQNGCATLLIFPRLMMPELELAPVIETKVQSVAVVSSGQSLDHSS